VSQRLTSRLDPALKVLPRPTGSHFAVLTCGGDAPGMNAALRAVVRNGVSRGLNVRVPMKDTQVSLKGTLSGLGRAI
jgi:hypothetical protein